MAASLIRTGAIDDTAGLAAHGEIFSTFPKLQPFLDEIRQASDEPDFCMHLENVVMADQNASAIMHRRREAIRLAAKSPSS